MSRHPIFSEIGKNYRLLNPAKTEKIYSHAVADRDISRILCEMRNQLPETYRHLLSSSILGTDMAVSIFGYDSDEPLHVCMALLIHDSGKLDVSRYIVQKRDKLTQQEYEIMRHHVIGSLERAETTEPVIGWLSGDVGYHHGFKKKSPYVASRNDSGEIEFKNPDFSEHSDIIKRSMKIVAVADVTDRLASEYPTRPALPPERIIEELRKEFIPDDDIRLCIEEVEKRILA